MKCYKHGGGVLFVIALNYSHTHTHSTLPLSGDDEGDSAKKRLFFIFGNSVPVVDDAMYASRTLIFRIM